MDSGNKSIILSNSNDARILVNFTDDDLKVYADFIPPIKGGNPLTEEYVNVFLQKMEIKNGILYDNIKDALERCNTVKRLVKDVLIARGELPVDELPAYYELDSGLRAPSRPEVKEGTKTDYRAWSPFIIVRKDQALAFYHPAVAGKTGKTVHGKEVPFRTIQKQTFAGGKNTATGNQYIVSEIDGLFVLFGNVLNVEPVLVIRGAIGYETGNINFPNDVQIRGSVNDGFKLVVGGNLTVKETLDVSDIIVKNNLNVSGGMIGRGLSLAKVSGLIETRFIQNCRIAGKKKITVQNDIINSTIYTMESLEVSDKGIILGSEIFAFNRVRAGRIGKENSAQTKIHIGLDWTINQDIENNENMMRIIEAKLEKVQSYLVLPELNEDKLSKIQEMKDRLDGEYKKCLEKQEDFNQKLIADRDAYLECTGLIAPDTLVEICGIEFIVKRALSAVRLVLDQNTTHIVPLPLVNK
ncbi:MAG: FapA family protein [Spirochaetaceae bacterium]|jgi:uncharacterized protein (DUF342 family)|nr:FapA family protein [Spirochaetaceae bacterium]